MSALRALLRYGGVGEGRLADLRGRGMQEVAKLGERLLGAGVGEMSDAALEAEIRPQFRGGSAAVSAARVLERLVAPGCGPARAAEAARDVSSREAIVAAADRARRGEIDLGGLGRVPFRLPIDWHRDVLTGRRLPLVHWSALAEDDAPSGVDAGAVRLLNRHAHFVTLGQAYALEGDDRYARAFAAQLESWMDANPPNLGINWARSAELAVRSVSWLRALALFAGSSSIDRALAARALKHLVAHGRHVAAYLSTYTCPDARLVAEGFGLYTLGTALPGLRRAREWRDTGRRVLLEQLAAQVRPDGVHFEQSTTRHAATAELYVHYLATQEALGESDEPEVRCAVAHMLDHLAWMTRPDGTVPTLGEDDGLRLPRFGIRRPGDFRDALAAGAALFGRGDWKAAAGPAPELVWLLGPDGQARYEGLDARPGARLSRAFAEGGYFVTRDGWGGRASWAVLDCGPHGALGGAHAHSDALSFEFCASGTPWVVDPGSAATANGRAAREACRLTGCHNTVIVNGRGQSEPGGSSAWETEAACEPHELVDGGGAVLVRGSHDGYVRLKQPVHHTRTMLMVRGDDALGLPAYLVLVDAMRGEGLHGYTVRMQLSPGSRAAAAGSRVEARRGDEVLRLECHGGPAVRSRVERGWVAPSYGAREEAPAAAFDVSGVGPQQLVSFVLPGAAGRHVFRVEPQSSDRGHAFVVEAGNVRDMLIVEGLRGSAGGAVPRETLLWARFVGGRITSVLRLEGDGPPAAPPREEHAGAAEPVRRHERARPAVRE